MQKKIEMLPYPYFPLYFYSASALLLWFIPWVLVLFSGLLFYFPYHADGEGRFLRVTGPITTLWSSQWVPGRYIPSTCRSALVASEDAQFYQHYGIDIKSIQENLKRNKRIRKIKRGGSTITQQLVKNAFLGREKTYLRKMREIIGAIILDYFMTKEYQQSWYFNIIEYGPEIYGLEQAAQFYFKTSAQKLSPSQCVALVTIIPAPRKWGRSLAAKRPSAFFARRFYSIISRMRQMGLESRQHINQARLLRL